MNDLTNAQKSAQITAQDQVINAHQFLLDFLKKFDTAQRGGIHDFIELSIFNMINSAIKNIDDYLQTGHKQVDATQIMHIVADSYQKILDGIKRNLETMNTVNFK
jgi:phosphopantothenate synthetase